MDSAAPAPGGKNPGFFVRMLGPLTIIRGQIPIELPASRKARALLAYLALSPGAVGRGRLCDLLWDVPNDPRGELRWCLSKLRNILDEPQRPRVQASDDRVTLDLSGCLVDAFEVASAAATGFATIDLDRLGALSRLFVGEFLEGLNIDRSPNFSAWLTAQRRRFSACHAAILEQLALKLPPGCEEASSRLEKWIEIAPFDRRAQSMLLSELARQGKIAQGEEHLATTARLFESEGLDFAPIRAAWRSARQGRPTHTRAAEPALGRPAEP
ncbi:MAG TPA: transcriptional regulator, partial [Roseiarcus sp.]|nr:transcriptional regulator [Roseiarcus sp.]